MMKIGIPTHASDLFVWNGRSGVGWEYSMPRIWNEIHKGERSFCIRSNRTGDVKVFRLERKHYDGPHIHAYTFRSEDGIEMVIFAH
jgi:hypothetical protein